MEPGADSCKGIRLHPHVCYDALNCPTINQ